MTPADQRRLGVIASFAVIAIGVVTSIASSEVRDTLHATMRSLTPMAVLATIPGQIASLLLCSAALRVLDPGPGFPACVVSRCLRDAGGNLFAFAPGVGELAGARALALLGSRSAVSVAATAVDLFSETIAQIPFAIFGVALLGVRAQFAAPAKMSSAMLLGGVAVLAIALMVGLWRRSWIARLCRSAAFARLWAMIWDKGRSSPAAIALHAAAWACGGVQVWCACAALGWRIGFAEALALESVVYAARACAFVLPAGLGVQEAAFVVAGHVVGLAPEQGLALSVVLRVRDLLFGAPVLLLWPWLEIRAGQAT